MVKAILDKRTFFLNVIESFLVRLASEQFVLVDTVMG